MIELTGATKLADLLTAYPWLKEALPGVHENFKLLDSPLGAVMARKATVAEMSRRSGLEEAVIIKKLKELMEAHLL